ncbi:hypothetical protein TKK_0013546 [Trichogramma kaykai]|uniref:CCHC-type domain-containing protein n=1 Tax=Trichogramma kaykai TaxID=54128 RepID=A0ABD2WHX3_9HYME
MSRRNHIRPLIPDLKGGYRRTRFSSPNEIPSLLSGPVIRGPAPMREPPERYGYDSEEEFPAESRAASLAPPLPPLRNFPPRASRFHPYENSGRFSRLEAERSSLSKSKEIPSLLDPSVQMKPPPLIPPATVRKLRESLRAIEAGDNFGERYAGPSSRMSDYAREEQETKQTIEEIIKVAQALKEQLSRDDASQRVPNLDDESERDSCDESSSPSRFSGGRPFVKTRQDTPRPRPDPSKLPRLMDLKPKIPSLLDIRIGLPPPPPPIADNFRENIVPAARIYPTYNDRSQENCWNCNERGHYYEECGIPRRRRFCFQCGQTGVDAFSCTRCNLN